MSSTNGSDVAPRAHFEQEAVLHALLRRVQQLDGVHAAQAGVADLVDPRDAAFSQQGFDDEAPTDAVTWLEDFHSLSGAARSGPGEPGRPGIGGAPGRGAVVS